MTQALHDSSDYDHNEEDAEDGIYDFIFWIKLEKKNTFDKPENETHSKISESRIQSLNFRQQKWSSSSRLIHFESINRHLSEE